MRETKQWRTTLTGRSDGDFWLLSFFLSRRKSVHSAPQCQPSWAGFHLASWVVVFFFSFPLLRTISPGANWGHGDGRVPAVLEKKKRNAALEGRTHLKAGPPVCRSVFPSRLGCHHSALPSAEQSSQAVPEEHRTGRPLIVPLGFSSLSWIPFAALILRRLVCADWPLWILD